MQAVTTRSDESSDEEHREKTSQGAKRARPRSGWHTQDYEGRSALGGGGYYMSLPTSRETVATSMIVIDDSPICSSQANRDESSLRTPHKLRLFPRPHPHLRPRPQAREEPPARDLGWPLTSVCLKLGQACPHTQQQRWGRRDAARQCHCKHRWERKWSTRRPRWGECELC